MPESPNHTFQLQLSRGRRADLTCKLSFRQPVPLCSMNQDTSSDLVISLKASICKGNARVREAKFTLFQGFFSFIGRKRVERQEEWRVRERERLATKVTCPDTNNIAARYRHGDSTLQATTQDTKVDTFSGQMFFKQIRDK